jgi:hypothetical protein
MVGAELAQAVEKLQVQLRALLTALDLVKKPRPVTGYGRATA